MSWIEKILPRTKSLTKSNVPEGIWTKCGDCAAVLYKTELEKQLIIQIQHLHSVYLLIWVRMIHIQFM